MRSAKLWTIYDKQVEYGFKSLWDLLFRLILIQWEREYSVNKVSVSYIAEQYKAHWSGFYIEPDWSTWFSTDINFFKETGPLYF